MLYTVRGLTGDARGVFIRVRIVSKGEVRTVTTKDGVEHRVVDLYVGDRTGAYVPPEVTSAGLADAGTGS